MSICNHREIDAACAPALAARLHELRASDVTVGSLESIAPGQGRAYVVGDRTIAVFRQRDGRMFACDAVCPHAGGPLADGLLGDGVVLCPLHGLAFDLRTGRSPREDVAVRVYGVGVRQGTVVVRVSE